VHAQKSTSAPSSFSVPLRVQRDAELGVEDGETGSLRGQISLNSTSMRAQ